MAEVPFLRPQPAMHRLTRYEEANVKNSTLTQVEMQKIAEFVSTHPLGTGMGSQLVPCSLAAINLALSGELTDTIPECMSEVIGSWIIVAQDTMPGRMRNSKAWKALLPLAAGTGHQHETERFRIVMDWVWNTVLPSVQHIADRGGYGAVWRRMSVSRDLADLGVLHSIIPPADAALRSAVTELFNVNVVINQVGTAVMYATAVAFYTSAAQMSPFMPIITCDESGVVTIHDVASYQDQLTRIWELYDPCALLWQLIKVSESEPRKVAQVELSESVRFEEPVQEQELEEEPELALA